MKDVTSKGDAQPNAASKSVELLQELMQPRSPTPELKAKRARLLEILKGNSLADQPDDNIP